jgi:hypothetical protein
LLKKKTPLPTLNPIDIAFTVRVHNQLNGELPGLFAGSVLLAFQEFLEDMVYQLR